MMTAIATSVSDLIRRVRVGDQDAATELVQLYEPELRRKIRLWLRLTDPRLRRVVDSADICQSVLAKFFARVGLGQYDLDQPGQLRNLLLKMARNKFGHHVRDQQAQRRDMRRLEDVSGSRWKAIAGDDSPSHAVAMRELANEVRGRLSEDERRLVELRGAGREWAEIAAEMGGTAEGRRKQLARAIECITVELRLGESDDERIR